MTIEEMRRAWTETADRLERLEGNFTARREEAMAGKRRTALDSLASRYKRFSLISLLFVFISPLYLVNHVFDDRYGILIPIFMAAYFGIASCMDWWLYKKVSSIDISLMPSEEVVSTVALCRRRHFQFMVILIPLMIGMVVLFILGSEQNKYMIISICFGIIIGLILGLRQLINFMHDYKLVRS